jgi:hypothetical protein
MRAPNSGAFLFSKLQLIHRPGLGLVVEQDFGFAPHLREQFRVAVFFKVGFILPDAIGKKGIRMHFILEEFNMAATFKRSDKSPVLLKNRFEIIHLIGMKGHLHYSLNH